MRLNGRFRVTQLTCQRGPSDPELLCRLSTFPQLGHTAPALLSAHLVPPRGGMQPARAAQRLSPVTISRQVNTTLPARTLLFGWGPYALLYLSATIVDVSSISPKLQMVRSPPGPRVRTLSISVSLCLAPSLFPAFWPPGSLFLFP